MAKRSSWVNALIDCKQERKKKPADDKDEEESIGLLCIETKCEYSCATIEVSRVDTKNKTTVKKVNTKTADRGEKKKVGPILKEVDDNSEENNTKVSGESKNTSGKRERSKSEKEAKKEQDEGSDNSDIVEMVNPEKRKWLKKTDRPTIQRV